MGIVWLGVVFMISVAFLAGVGMACVGALHVSYWEEAPVRQFRELKARLRRLRRGYRRDRKEFQALVARRDNTATQLVETEISNRLQQFPVERLIEVPDIGPQTVAALRGQGLSSFMDIIRLNSLDNLGIPPARAMVIREQLVKRLRDAAKVVKDDFWTQGPITRSSSKYQALVEVVELLVSKKLRMQQTLREMRVDRRELKSCDPPSFLAFGAAIVNGSGAYNEVLGWALAFGLPISLIALGRMLALQWGEQWLSQALYWVGAACVAIPLAETWFQYVPGIPEAAESEMPNVKLSTFQRVPDVSRPPEPFEESAEAFLEPVRAPIHRERHPPEPIMDTALASAINAMELHTGNGFRGTLYRYQETGAKFLVSVQKALLGDEMGLGKTVQALAALAHLKQSNGAVRPLVICPAPLLHNWEREVRRFTIFEPVILQGPKRGLEYGRLLRSRTGIGLISYDTFIRDYPYGDKLPAEWTWDAMDVVILDEAQRIKNACSKTAVVVKQMMQAVPYRFLMTGTPLENRIEDFFSLTEAIGNPLGNPYEAAGELRSWTISKLRREASNFYLRRKKDEVIEDLPKVVRENAYTEMGIRQTRSYREILSQGGGWDTIMSLRQAVNICPQSGDSSKMEFLREYLAESEQEGDKVLVFSFFKNVLDLIQEETGTDFRIDGDVKPKHRTQLMEEFSNSSEPEVMALQIKAGATGLNLQAANRVVIFEPQWNPAVEEQAIGRAHRIHQKKTVFVVRLLTVNTIEESVEAVLEQKRELFKDVVDEAELARKLGMDWKNLLARERAKAGITAA